MKEAEDRSLELQNGLEEDIREFGCGVLTVVDPKGQAPTFSYSVGIQATSGVAEAIVVGTPPELGHFMVNEYNQQVRAGKKFKRGVRYAGFLSGFDIYIEPTKKVRVAGYTLACDRYYARGKYEVVQLIYPTTSGLWPWEPLVEDWFQGSQPMLGRKRPDRP